MIFSEKISNFLTLLKITFWALRGWYHEKSVKKRVFPHNSRIFLARTVWGIPAPFHGVKVPSCPQLFTRVIVDWMLQSNFRAWNVPSSPKILQKAAKMHTKLLLRERKKSSKTNFFELSPIHFYAFGNGPRRFLGVLRDPGGPCERTINFLSDFFRKNFKLSDLLENPILSSERIFAAFWRIWGWGVRFMF